MKHLATLILLVLGQQLSAHQFWIEPHAFVAPAGQRVAVSLKLGEPFVGDELVRDPRHLQEFSAVGAFGRTPVPGIDGLAPAGMLWLRDPGITQLIYVSRGHTHEMDPDKFRKYVLDEGLTRAALPAPGAGPVSERFMRCAKSLVRLQGVDAAASNGPLPDPVGMVLELVPRRLPSPAVRRLELELLYNGKPLSGALVKANPASAPLAQLQTLTDAAGRASFALDADGVWLVHTVHLEAADPDDDVRWQSWWASLTFEVGGGESVADR